MRKDNKDKKLSFNEKNLVYIADAFINKFINEDEYNESVAKNKEELLLIKQKISENERRIIKFKKMNFSEKRILLLDIVKYINIDMYKKNVIKVEYRYKLLSKPKK